jgi:nickel/cobalt exporter
MLSGSIAIIGVGFALGLMHALDADHVMAVSALGNRKPGLFRVVRFCLHWALGHAGVLLLSGMLLFGLGVHLPESLQHSAEWLVGVLLIVLGLSCFWQFRRQRLSIEEHTHDSGTHRHWHIEGDATLDGHGNRHGKEAHAPVMVGVVHGLAGSAPALALVPAVAQGQVLAALVYLLVFSLGVMLSMLVFGLGFGALQQHLKARHARLFNWHRHVIAAGSVLVGGYWLSQAM